jgi:hypothetical protein
MPDCVLELVTGFSRLFVTSTFPARIHQAAYDDPSPMRRVEVGFGFARPDAQAALMVCRISGRSLAEYPDNLLLS